MKHKIDEQTIELFSDILKNQERSEKTIEKYMRDIRRFQEWLGDEKEFDKQRVILYKEELQRSYKPNSTNSMLTALNSFFKNVGWGECRVATLKIQRASFRSPDRDLSKEEYRRLLAAAEERGNIRLIRIMETIASTGIRISELASITVEALRTGRAVVTLKRKTREVILTPDLCKKLTAWCRERGITSGSIFVTRTGRPLDRSNILHMMKALAEAAGVLRSKIFPHNLRHRFAVDYYEREKDIVRLADLLGHSNINTTRIYTMTTCEKELTVLSQIAAACLWKT